VTADTSTVAYADNSTTPTPAVAARPVQVEPAVGVKDARHRWQQAKRVIDPVLAGLILVVISPLMLLIALAIRLDSRGPVFFRQRRIGLRMRDFECLKFRTMIVDASPELHQRYIAELVSADGDGMDGLKKLTDDPRVTRVGRFLRSTSLDELPQLLNVLAGRMALVGPRPSIAYELEHYDAVHFDRFTVLPGMTGLWQVSGRNELGFREMLELDVRYARTTSPWVDLQILVRTPITLVRRVAA